MKPDSREGVCASDCPVMKDLNDKKRGCEEIPEKGFPHTRFLNLLRKQGSAVRGDFNL